MTAVNRPPRQCGYATMEYLCACAALAAALLVPIRDDASPDKARTAVQIVLDAVGHAYQNFSYAISLPG